MLNKTLVTVLAVLIFESILVSRASIIAAEDGDIRARLLEAAEGTRVLFRAARASKLGKYVQARLSEDRKASNSTRFPTYGDVRRYAGQRPWSHQYSIRFMPCRRPVGEVPQWPGSAEASELRKLLSDASPVVRGLSAESLATLQLPEDVPRIAALLDDHAECIHALGWNMILLATPIDPKELGGHGVDAMDIERSWYPRRVSGYAKAALKLMTGRELNSENFQKWWIRNKGGYSCVWYWRERLHRNLAAVATGLNRPKPTPEVTLNGLENYFRQWKLRVAEAEHKMAAVRQDVAEELAKQPAEVEVKVRLLALNGYSSSLGVGLDEPLLGSFDCDRWTPEQLLSLLERRVAWKDVDWDMRAYNTVVVQLAGQADRFFSREHVAALRKIQKSETQLWWDGQAALSVGIARLLPVARSRELDDPDSMDGVLRAGVRSLKSVFARGTVARELVRSGLPRNWEFLKDQLFAEGPQHSIPDLRSSIIQELGKPPLTKQKRVLLVDLVLDKRFESLWTEPRGAMGDDQHRLNAMRAVNAYGGKDTLPNKYDLLLATPEQSAKSLIEVKNKIRNRLVRP